MPGAERMGLETRRLRRSDRAAGLAAAARRRLRRAAIATVASLVALPVIAFPAHSTVPDGFEDVVVADVNGPTDLAWTPDGRMLVTGKNGQLWIIENGAVLPSPAIDLSSVMCTNGERALGSVAVHPDFASNGFVYLYYTFRKFDTCNESETDGPVNRLSRFELVGNSIDPASEVVLFDTSSLFRDHHNGGDIIFAADGFLYVTVGDGGTRSLDRPQDPGYLLGKVLRMTDSGAVPPGNPFTGPGTARCNVSGVPAAGAPEGTKCQEVFALGLRNPFRFAADPGSATPRFYINDVGQHSYEEVNELTAAGTDFGWPSREGPCVFDAPTDCEEPPPALTDPVHWYPHGPDGGAATGAAFVPAGVWPAEYDGAYLFADYVLGNIYRLVPNAGENRAVDPPTSRFDAVVFADIPQVVSMEFGPHNGGQSLYYVTREGDGIHRIDYVGAANRAPVAVAQANPTSGPAPLTVQFDGTGSSDPDGDPLSYAWDFDGDGTTDATGPDPVHIYDEAGTFFAVLVVDDGAGGSSSDSVRVDPGGSPPVPVIESPADGATFTVGQQIVLTGSATDQDEQLGDAALTWEVRQHHNTHYHPFLDATQGNDLEIIAPEPEDLLAATNSYLEVLLTATDSSGISTTVSRIVQPEKVNLTFESAPSGLELIVEGTAITTPSVVVSWRDHVLSVAAPDQTDASGTLWNWDNWSDGGDRSHEIGVTGPATYTTTFVEGVSDILTFSPTDDATIRLDRPDRNEGLEPAAEVDASPVKDALFRFEVSGLAGRQVSSATLRLFVTNSSPDGGTIRTSSDAAWDEATVTWNTAPDGDGDVVAQVGDVDSGQWVEVDVSSAVQGDGPVSLRLSSSSANGVDYASLQDPGGRTPQLIVLAGAPPGPDVQPPTPPANLTAVADTPTEIELSWTPSTDNVGVVAYDLYRCDGPPSPWGAPCEELLTAVEGSTLAYEDVTVSPDSTYTYEVRARDAAGNISSESNAASATTPAPDTTPPTPPSDVVGAAVGPTHVDLSWTESVDDTELARYDVYRDGSLLDSVAAPAIAYSDTGAVPDTLHAYWLVAVDTSGNESAASEAVEVQTPGQPSQVVVPVSEDATVRENRPDRNYGDDLEVESDGLPVKDGLLKFAIPELGALTVQSARLRLYVVNSSSSGGAIGTTSGAWSQDTVTWSTAPSSVTHVGTIGDVRLETWVELDVTEAITGAGELSFRLSSTSTNGVAYQSMEGGPNAPEIVLVVG